MILLSISLYIKRKNQFNGKCEVSEKKIHLHSSIFQDLHVSCLVNEKFYLIKSQLLQHISLSYTHRICIALVTHFNFYFNNSETCAAAFTPRSTRKHN